ncbi:MAG: hypothetical protein AB7G37_21660 [Solirubrobacteraceae bacterium]
MIATYWHDEIGRFIAAAPSASNATASPHDLARGIADAVVWMVERVYYQRVLDDDPEEDQLAIWTRTLDLPA